MSARAAGAAIDSIAAIAQMIKEVDGLPLQELRQSSPFCQPSIDEAIKVLLRGHLITINNTSFGDYITWAGR